MGLSDTQSRAVQSTGLRIVSGTGQKFSEVALYTGGDGAVSSVGQSGKFDRRAVQFLCSGIEVHPSEKARRLMCEFTEDRFHRAERTELRHRLAIGGARIRLRAEPSPIVEQIV